MLRVITILGLGVATVLPAIGTNAVAQKPELLRYKFQLTKPVIYESVNTTRQKQSVAGMNIETNIKNTEITIRTLQRIDSNKNLQIQTENKLLQVKMKVGPLGEYSYDSQSDANEKGSMLGGALTPVYDSLSGAILTEVVSPRGEVIESKGFEELLGAALKDNPLGQQFSGGGTNKARKFGLTEFYPIMSKKPVKPGDTWEEAFEFSLPKLGSAKGKRNYKFEAWDKVGSVKTAKITYTTELTFKIDLDQGGQKATGELAIQKSSGTVQFDPKAGRVVTLKSEFTLGGTINVSVNGMDLAVETNQTQSVAMKLLDKLPMKKD